MYKTKRKINVPPPPPPPPPLPNLANNASPDVRISLKSLPSNSEINLSSCSESDSIPTEESALETSSAVGVSLPPRTSMRYAAMCFILYNESRERRLNKEIILSGGDIDRDVYQLVWVPNETCKDTQLAQHANAFRRQYSREID